MIKQADANIQGNNYITQWCFSEDRMTKIEVVPYDSRWPEMFEAERKMLEPVLTEIYHIGSTSVPGLPSKPKIDIIAVAKDLNEAMVELENIGYSYKGEWNIPLQAGFIKRANIDVNLHVFFDSNHPEIELNLRFRDYLSIHPEVCDQYAAIKKEILQDESSQEKINGFPLYTIRKRDFIDGIIKTIGYNRLRVLKSITDKERDFIKNYQDEYEYFILYKGADIIGYASVFNESMFEYYTPDEESLEYLLDVMGKRGTFLTDKTLVLKSR
ncbi:MAG: GrpB family protein [Holosporales bacterium]|jgi:GrpB-like predicted nucleotidyltransferase (UPF0157 family)|nr:GrpB family protein [Holosporales bacterium]